MSNNFKLTTLPNKSIFILLLFSSLFAFLFVACRPEIVANDKLNGDWFLQSINNKPIAKGDYETLHFEKMLLEVILC